MARDKIPYVYDEDDKWLIRAADKRQGRLRIRSGKYNSGDKSVAVVAPAVHAHRKR